MLIRTKEAPIASGAALRRLQLSLNSPVVAIDELLVGPATACIAVYGPPNASNLVLALRSVRSGQVAYFAPEAAGPLADVELAIEVATGFAEAMGFLFDEDMFADRDHPRAISRVWHAFLAEDEPPEAEPVAAAEPVLLSKFRFQPALSPLAQALPPAANEASTGS